MILTRPERERIRTAFQARIGNTALPSNATIDDLCANLILALPALLDTCEAQATRLVELTKKMEEDPCP